MTHEDPMPDETRYSARAPAPFWSRGPRIASAVEGPYRKRTWLERLMRRLAWMLGSQ